VTAARLQWLEPPGSLDAACPLCRNSYGNVVFLVVHEGAQAVIRGSVVEVARCGGCASAWFPGMDVDDSYPRPDRSALTEDLWLLIDHYVELVGGLDWKVAYSERLVDAGVARVLEVGCGIGLFLDYAHRSWGAEVVGLEPSAYGLAGAERLGVRIEPCYMDDFLATAPTPFDLVIATEVIEHARDPGAFLRELRALVRPGGMALVTTPNAAGLTPSTRAGELYAILSVGAHRSVLSEERLSALAREAGFGWVQVAVKPIALIAVLADQPMQLPPFPDPRPYLLQYHSARLAHPVLASSATRPRLADLIARYVAAHELDEPDACAGESEIDKLLRTEFDVDVLDLASLVRRVEQATNIFEFGHIAPFSLASYLLHRGRDDNLSKRARTEMWEAAVVLIGRGMSIDPVNLFMLGRSLDATLAALAGRRPGRWNRAARSALASAPEFGDQRLRRAAEIRLRSIVRAVTRTVRVSDRRRAGGDPVGKGSSVGR